MMARLNPDFLISEEVGFEIRIRGEEPAPTADERRRQLRGLLRSNKGLVDASEVDLDREKDLTWCRERSLELLASADDLGDLPDRSSRSVFRLRMCLEHMERRLLFWRRSCDSDEKWADMPLLTKIMEGIVKLSTPNETDVEGDGAPLDSIEGGEAPPALTAPLPTAPVVAVPGIGNSALPSPIGASDANLSNFQVRPTVSSVVSQPGLTLESSLSVNYNRLPNPLGQLLQHLPVTDGLDVDQLLNFLGTLLRIKEFPGMNDVSLLQVAFPYCRSPLAEKLLSSLGSGSSFDDFHRAVLETFLPGRMKERLCQEKFYRLQDSRETLASFIASIKWVAKVLRIGLSESAVVDTILEGITPEERSRMVFATRPNSYAELDKLSVTSRMVAYTDGLRQQERRRDWQSSNTRPVMQIQEVHDSGALAGQRKEFVCWGCGLKGHTRRFCRQQGRKPQQGGASSSAQSGSSVGNLPKNVVAGGEQPK